MNESTVIQPYPIPHMEETILCFGNAKFFSVLDLSSGFHQIKVVERDRFKTAFITRDGLFKWNCMPFGLVNAPYTFQRMMTHIFKDLLWKSAIIYMDDILIFSDSYEKHLESLRIVFDRLNFYSLKLKASKCVFGVESVEFLGLQIQSGGIITISENKRRAATELAIPKT